MYYLGLCASVLEQVVKIFSGVVLKLFPISDQPPVLLVILLGDTNMLLTHKGTFEIENVKLCSKQRLTAV